MNRYTTIKQLGDGTYGSVLLGRSIESGELIAIKKNKLFPESAIRNIMYQILQGLAFIHKHGFFHRDLKPENLLCMGPELVKIADFGLAREIRSRPPYTDYVSTRWAPEVLLRSTNYSSPIDVWAVGCIMAEVYTLRPLFPGASEIDTIFKICQVLGTPKKTDWPEGYQLSSAMNFLWPQCIPNNLKTLIPNASSEAIQLLRDMLQWDPKKRPTASQALRYPYFQIGHPLGSVTQDSGKQQKDVQAKTGLPTYIKPAPPAQPPTKAHTLISSRPNQTSQPPQHFVYPYKGEASRADQPSHLQEGKPSPTLFPSLHNKNLQPKILAGVEHKNGEIKPKTRRRWGLISRSTKGSDDWADLDDLDFSPSFTRIDVKNKKRQSDDPLCRQVFESVLDLKPSEPVGINVRNGVLPNPGKDFPPSNPWSSSGLSGKSSGTVSVVSKITSGKVHLGVQCPVGSGSTSSSGLTGGYIPSFLKKEIGSVMQRVQLTPLADPAPGYSSLKAMRPHPGRPFFHTQPRSTPGLIPRPPAAQPVHGRIDWSSKYPSHRKSESHLDIRYANGRVTWIP
ncbi:serine/threonine-protein kinase ICK-like protein [Cricetulus griseus]|uniref:Serine/threonine-protein kinase ICK-like protein n=1 Tax=Cricetulus griseus TaxID=10029 RepID=A0A061I1T9_CRIGR|nr:serine/threonine-protein kinase ICK-like protein [Cricetulus griseus]